MSRDRDSDFADLRGVSLRLANVGAKTEFPSLDLVWKELCESE